jgi:hypothetical protein
MTQYVTIVLAVENMANFDVEFKSEIHGGKVVAMAKFDALAVADKACEALKSCDCFDDRLDEINAIKRGV